MKYTLNQIHKKLQQFASDHLQVNGFSFGELEEISNDGITQFPYMYCILKPSSLSDQSVKISISIIVMDAVHRDLSNRMEVWSDTLLTLTDLRAYMNDPDFDDYFTLENNMSITPFADRFSDDVSGWSMDVNFIIQDLKDRCAIPR